MKRLLRLAFFGRQHRFLVTLMVLSMILLTFACQLEIIALGIITRKGPNFFELFAPIQEGKLQKITEIHWEEIKDRFGELDQAKRGAVSIDEAHHFLAQYKGQDLPARVISIIEKWLPISKNLKALAFFLVFVAIFRALTLFGQRFAARLLAIRISRNLRQEYFEHLQALPLHFYHQHNIGSLSSRVIGDASFVAEAFNACLVNYLHTPFTVLSTLLLCFFTSWQLSLIIFLGFPLIVYPIVFSSPCQAHF